LVLLTPLSSPTNTSIPLIDFQDSLIEGENKLFSDIDNI